MAVTQFSNTAKPHALTLGCTGMLVGTALGLEADGYAVSYLSRSGTLPNSSSGTAYTCDWENPASLTNAVRNAIEEHGIPNLALAWSHTVGPVLDLAKQLSNTHHTVQLHHVLGSRVQDPTRNNALGRIKQEFTDLPGIAWHAICLGFVRGEAGPRWLTHEEISEGALSAVRLKSPVYTIGQTAPWKDRP